MRARHFDASSVDQLVGHLYGLCENSALQSGDDVSSIDASDNRFSEADRKEVMLRNANHTLAQITKAYQSKHHLAVLPSGT